MNSLAIVEKSLEFEKMTKDQVRSFIHEVEEAAKKGEQIEIPLKHYFSNGVYGREITIPKGALIVGKIHKFQNMTVISKGEVSILSIDGAIRVKAPFTMISSPGVKRVILAHEETVWTTFHATPETDIKKIESELVTDDYSEVVELPKQEVKCLS